MLLFIMQQFLTAKKNVVTTSMPRKMALQVPKNHEKKFVFCNVTDALENCDLIN